jgi:HPt (histidine-containing phosphotransfer) domain-containing protein
MNGDPAKRADRNRTTPSMDWGAAPNPESRPAWSARQLLDRLGGDEELARELVTLFLTEHPRLLSRLHASFASGRQDDVRRAAHAAKGCIANFVEGGVVDTAFEIERLSGQGRLEDASALVGRLERELADLVNDMRDFETGDRCAS